MSALLGISQKDGVSIITDGAAIYLDTGRVASIARKQHFLRSGTMVVASIGYREPVERFAEFVEKRVEHFDELADGMQSLWQEARGTLSAEIAARPCLIVVAGFSAKSQRAEMHVLSQLNGECGFWPRAPGYIGGPGSDPTAAKPFHERLHKDRDAFDVRCDGLKFMEAMRRYSLRECEAGPRHAVGGFVQLTTVARDGIKSAVIHHWSDRVGHIIEPDAVIDPNTTYDETWPTMTLAELQAMRACGVASSTAPRLTVDDFRKVCTVIAQEMVQEEAART